MRDGHRHRSPHIPLRRHSRPERSHRPVFAARINFDRERMATQLPFPIVLWLEREAFRSLLRSSRPASQWVSARFDSDDIPESASNRLYSLLVLNAMSTPDSTHLDRVNEEILLRELKKFAETPEKIAVGRLIILLSTLGQKYLVSGKRAESRKTLREALALARHFFPVLSRLASLTLSVCWIFRRGRSKRRSDDSGLR